MHWNGATEFFWLRTWLNNTFQRQSDEGVHVLAPLLAVPPNGTTSAQMSFPVSTLHFIGIWTDGMRPVSGRNSTTTQRNRPAVDEQTSQSPASFTVHTKLHWKSAHIQCPDGTRMWYAPTLTDVRCRCCRVVLMGTSWRHYPLGRRGRMGVLR